MAAAAAAWEVDYSHLKLVCILMDAGGAVLSYALKCGTNKTASVTLLDHLKNSPVTSTANYHKLNGQQRRKAFNSDEKKKIAEDPSCQSFDVTLLYKSIRLACENVAEPSDKCWQDDTVMEGLLTKIKDERNTCVHERPQMTDEQQFLDKVKKLKSLFITALQAIKERYDVSDDETTSVSNNITTQIQDILQAFTDKVILQMNFDKQLHLFKQESVSHLREIYKQFEKFYPLSFLSVSQEWVHIQTVFSNLVLEEPTSLEIDSLDLLKVVTAESQGSQPDEDQRPRLAVVSGVAGSGKTTLLTFILSEWLKEECDRRVTHLEEYDIVLRMVCRDTDAEDLEMFLGLALSPNLSCLKVHNNSLIGYLKHCKVLFLIDGLDELNSTSEKLVTNILNTTKYNKNFSILATSRPERVHQFLARTRQDYKQSEISIKGIPALGRTEFALQYCTSTNQDKLREFIRKQKNIKLFELPINLLLMVTVFENNPNCITENTTQASLYSRIHEWCTEELRDRISVHPTWGKKRPHTLRARIKRVVKEMYQVALQGLLLDRQSLSEEDTEWLTDCCEREDLPAQEVLEAFFTLQSSITNRIRQENYVMHHKGMLEYFAARHIMQCLQGGSHPGPGAISSLLQGAAQPQTQPLGLHYGFHPEPGAIRSLPQGAAQPQTQPLGLHYGFHPEPGAIRSLPRGAARPQTQPLDLQGLRNLFWHVAGMLATEEAPNCTESIKEVIELLGKTGAAWDEWLSLVEDTDYNESFLQGIAHHVTENPSHGTVRISDNSLASAAALLPRTPTTTVLVTMQNEKVNVENVRALVDHHCSELHLQHHYKHPANTCVSDTVLRAIHRSHLKVFTGHLSANCVVVLPECLEELCLAVSSDEHTASLTAVLTQAISSLPNLRRLVIHVPVAMVTPAAVLSPLPDIRDVSLALSGVDKSLMEEACHVAAALQPRTGYDVTAFPWGSMEAAEWRRLLHLLAAAPARGRWGGVWIPEETITEEEETELMDLADALLGCGLFRHPSEECFLSYSPDE
ncbi:uncharacterized protein LOC135096158 isoform X2 [Scylla paramamosain]|uniref:uncharacterized protein LOC135096158 isoform X2 n=1 Tax=Scylla paramamosain TaxID=85552 RepID=UPI003083B375